MIIFCKENGVELRKNYKYKNVLIYEEKIDENKIITSRIEVPEIWWKDTNDKKHRYYVDIFIINENRMIEVKSTWTYKNDIENIFLKQRAAKDAGYKCEIDKKKVIATY